MNTRLCQHLGCHIVCKCILKHVVDNREGAIEIHHLALQCKYSSERKEDSLSWRWPTYTGDSRDVGLDFLQMPPRMEMSPGLPETILRKRATPLQCNTFARTLIVCLSGPRSLQRPFNRTTSCRTTGAPCMTLPRAKAEW